MADSPLLSKSKAFALEIIRVCNEIKRSQKESILTNQLVRSGTSIGANVAEAQQAQSTPDFVSKMSISLKEASETKYWIKLLFAANYLTESESTSILNDCIELEKILVSIIKSSK